MKIMSYSYKLLLCLSLLLSTNALKAIEGFSLIPAGAFTMGNSVAEDTDITDAPTREVTLDAFYMGKYEVTWAEWKSVLPWAIANGYSDLVAADIGFQYTTVPITIGQNHVDPSARISGKLVGPGELSTNPSNSDGRYATAMLDSSKALYIKGDASYGGTGNNTYTKVLDDVVELHCVAEGTFVALTSSGLLKSYGNWSGGNLTLNDIKSIATSASGFVALDGNGKVHKAGAYQGANEIGPPSSAQIKFVFAGGYGGYGAIDTSGNFWVWGYGSQEITDNKSEMAVGIGFEYGNVGILFEDGSAIGMASSNFTVVSGWESKNNHPVHSITWYEMVKWCNARSQKEGLTPVYYTNDAQTTIYKTGDVDVTNAQVKWTANGYRLPTEAEWEKAARGGLSSKRFPWGDTISHSQANYYASSSFSYDSSGSVNYYHPTYATGSTPYTSPVGAFAANGYGLYDMAGNVLEFCWDWHGTYAADSQVNPRGSTSGSHRVCRGGDWNNGVITCRVALRGNCDPTFSFNIIGFRVVRSAIDTDSDSDGLVDSVETNTGVFISASNTGTNPNSADTDADGVPDGLEVKEKTSPVDATKFNSFSKGLVAYYPFDGNADDESGNGHDIPDETLVYSDDRDSQKNMSLALANSFASSNPVYLNSNAPRTFSQWVKVVDFPNTTASGWIKPNMPYFAYPSSVIIGNGFAADGEWWMDTGSGVAFYDWDITTNWAHMVVVYDGDVTQAKVYRDGIQIPLKRWVFDQTAFASGDYNTLHFSITTWKPDNFSANNLIDDVRVYDRALTEAEVGQLYQFEAGNLDSDGDGLLDSVETNTGVFVSASNTGTNPNNADTDGDGLNDGAEVQQGTDPTKIDQPGWKRVATEVHRADLLRTTEGVFHTNNCYSTDGVNWKYTTFPPHSYWINASGYGGGAFVLTGAVGQIWTSDNFDNWTARSPGGEDITDVVYGNGIFIARKFWNTAGLWVSTNQGQTWTSADTGPVPDRGRYNKIAFGNNTFVRPAETDVKISTDGFNWTTITPPNRPSQFSFREGICYVPSSGFVLAQKVAESNGEVTIMTASSAQGEVWNFTEAKVSTNNTGDINISGFAGDLLFACAYDGSKYLTEVWCSADQGQSWQLVESGPWNSPDNDYAQFGSNGTILAVGTGSEIHTIDLDEFKNRLNDSRPRFQIVEGSYTWHEAKVDAEARGGRLAVLDTQEKMDQAYAYLRSLPSWPILHIGLSDQLQEGVWKWLNEEILNENLSIQNAQNGPWAALNEPNGGASENYAVLRDSYDSSIANKGGLADISNEQYSYLLEMPSDVPSAVDTDGDGLVDSVETNTGLFVSASNTGSDPHNPDSDGDFLGDGFEVNNSSDPNVKTESQAYGLKIKSVTKPSSFGSITNAKEIQLEGDTLAAWESSGNGNIHLFNFSEGQLTYQSSIASPDTSYDWPAFGAQMSLLGDRLVTGDPITWISATHDGRGYQYNIQDLQNPQFEHRLDRDAQTASYIGGYVLAVNGYSIFSSSGNLYYGSQNKVHIFRENGEFYQTWTDGYNKLIEFARSPSGNSFFVARTAGLSDPNQGMTTIDIYNVNNGEIQRSDKSQLNFRFSYHDGSNINYTSNQHSFHRFAFDGNKIYSIDDDYLRIFSFYDGAWNETSIDLRKYSGGSKFSSTNLLLGADFLIVSSPNADCRDASKGCVVIFDIDSANQTLRYRETITNSSAISGEFGSYVALDEKTGHLLVSTEFGSSHAWGVVNSNNGSWVIYEGLKDKESSFQIIEGSFTWHEAKADAEARGGRLAVLDTQEKIEQANQFLNTSGIQGDLLIGLTDLVNEGNWQWITGKPLSVSNWNGPTNEPNNGLGNNEEDAVQIRWSWNWAWNDIPLTTVSSGYLLETLESKKTVSLITSYHGTITGSGQHNTGTTATLTAKPDAGYIFSGWTGDATGTDNPLSLTIDADKVVGATFEPDNSDSDGDGLTNYAEVVTHYTNLNSSDSDADGYSDGEEVERGSDPNYSGGYPQVYLSFSSVGGGHIDASGIDYYDYGSYSGNVPLRSSVTLTAVPDSGYVFGGWVGDVTDEINPLELQMDSDKSIQANFEPDLADDDGDGLTNYDEATVHYTDLNSSDTDGDGYSDGEEVERGSGPNDSWSKPTVYLSFSSNEGGHIDASGIDYYDYWYYGSYSGNVPLRSSLTLTAVPDSGYLFNGWSGDASGTSNPLDLQMDASKSVQANFEPDNSDSDADGLTNYAEVVTHYTNPNSSDSDSDGYSDGEEVERGSNPNYSDSYPQVYLSFSSVGGGHIDASGIDYYDYWYYGSYSGNVPLRSLVTLTAIPDSGYVFGGWVGGVADETNPLELQMDSDKSIQANFEPDHADDDGDGLTNYDEATVHYTDLNSSDTDADGYSDGEEVERGSNPNYNWDKPRVLLSYSSNGSGYVNVSGADSYDWWWQWYNSYNVPLRSIVTLTAYPYYGYVFSAWSGDDSSSTNPLELQMDANKSVQANFEPDYADNDGDGLSNYEEAFSYYTNPDAPDSDEDGYSDGDEVERGSNPNDSWSKPMGSIGGFITASDEFTPLENVQVIAYKWHFDEEENHGYWEAVSTSWTSVDGSYMLEGLDEGSYRIGFFDGIGSYAFEYYGESSDLAAAQDIEISEADQLVGLDASLAEAAYMTGLVIDSGGTPVDSVCVEAYRWSDTDESWTYASGTSTDSNGSYVLSGLPNGKYRVGFFDWDRGSYATVYYNNTYDFESADDIQITEPGAIVSINTSLPERAHISGVVTGPDGATPLAGIDVRVYQWFALNDEQVDSGWWDVVGFASTEENGSYTISGLDYGKYRIGFADYDNQYVSEYYNDSPNLELAGDIAISAAATTASINASLKQKGRISGFVTDENDGSPLQGLEVVAYQWLEGDGDKAGAWQQIQNSWTDEVGAYDISGLDYGTYRVGFYDTAEWNYRTEYFNGAPNLESAQDIVFSDSVGLLPVNASLAMRDIPAELGEAMDSTSHAWIAGGDTMWFAQPGASYDGSDSAQSGPLSDEGQNWMQTTVMGPGSVKFWWKVSSEDSYDYLAFSISGEVQEAISGEVDWTLKEFNFGPGEHVLKWMYYKDGSAARGADAGWVDQVVIQSTKANQSITPFAPIGTKAFGTSAFSVTAPTASSILPVSLSVQSGPATISGNMVTITGAGTVVLAANQAGNANYAAATEMRTSFLVIKGAQSIADFTSIGSKTFGDAPFAVTAPSATSNLPVTLSVKSGPATISGNTVTLTGAGTVTLAAKQAGNTNYNAATEVTTSFEVSKGAQTIGTFASIGSKTFGDAPFAVTAPSASSSLPVTLSVKSGPATISGNIVTITGAGTVVLAANQAGNANYNAASEVTMSFTVSKATHTIAAFASIENKTYGDAPFAITAPTSSIGLPVALSIKSGPATISGNTVTITGAGTVVLAAKQAGDANYAEATEVTTSFTVAKATQTIAAFADLENKTLGDASFAVAVPSATSGLPVTLSVKSGPATISGNTVTINGTGIVMLAANQSGNANYLAADPVIAAFAVMDIKSMAGDFVGNYDFDGAAELQDAYDYNGQLALKVSAGGAFSGSLVIRGSRLGVKGKFDKEGNADLVIKTKTLSEVTVELLIEPMNDKEYQVAANMVWPDQPSTPFNCYPVAYTGKGGEADFPLGGKQINSLMASQSTSGIDFGHGFAMIKTSKDGTLKFTGRAADGSAITGATRLVKDAFEDILAPVSFPLSAVKGLLHGVADIDSNPEEGQYHLASSSEWTWVRLPQTKAKTYKEGFAEKLGLYGQVWSFTKGQSALPEAKDGFTFQVDPDSVLLEEPLELSGKWPSSNKPVWDVAPPKGFTFKVNTATGQISGAAPRKVNGKAAKALSYQGLLVRPALDSYDGAPLFGGGYLLGTESSGVVELTTP